MSLKKNKAAAGSSKPKTTAAQIRMQKGLLLQLKIIKILFLFRLVWYG